MAIFRRKLGVFFILTYRSAFASTENCRDALNLIAAEAKSQAPRHQLVSAAINEAMQRMRANESSETLEARFWEAARAKGVNPADIAAIKSQDLGDTETMIEFSVRDSAGNFRHFTISVSRPPNPVLLALKNYGNEADALKNLEKMKASQALFTLSPSEIQSLKAYQSFDFVNLNRSLRSEVGVSNQIEATVHSLDSALSKGHLDPNTVLFRGLRVGNEIPLTKGAVFTDKAYVSTSLSQKPALNLMRNPLGVYDHYTGNKKVLQVIKIPATGSPPGLLLEGAEKEVLLPRGTTFKVVDIIPKDDVIIQILEIVH